MKKLNHFFSKLGLSILCWIAISNPYVMGQVEYEQHPVNGLEGREIVKIIDYPNRYSSRIKVIVAEDGLYLLNNAKIIQKNDFSHEGVIVDACLIDNMIYAITKDQLFAFDLYEWNNKWTLGRQKCPIGIFRKVIPNKPPKMPFKKNPKEEWLVRILGKNGCCSYFGPDSLNVESQYGGMNEFTDLVYSQESIFAIEKENVFRWVKNPLTKEGKIPHNIPLSQSIPASLSLINNQVYFGSTTGEGFLYHKNKISLVVSGIPDSITSINPGRSSKSFFIGTPKGLFYGYQPESELPQNPDFIPHQNIYKDNLYPLGYITQIHDAGKGEYLVGTKSNGLYRLIGKNQLRINGVSHYLSPEDKKIFFTKILILNKKDSVFDSIRFLRANDIDTLHLTEQADRLIIQLQELSVNKPSLVNFQYQTQYQIGGNRSISKEWSTSATGNLLTFSTANFQNDTRLSIRAVIDNQYSNPKELVVAIPKRSSSSGWYYLLVILIILSGLGYLIYSYLKMQEEQKTSRLAELEAAKAAIRKPLLEKIKSLDSQRFKTAQHILDALGTLIRPDVKPEEITEKTLTVVNDLFKEIYRFGIGIYAIEQKNIDYKYLYEWNKAKGELDWITSISVPINIDTLGAACFKTEQAILLDNFEHECEGYNVAQNSLTEKNAGSVIYLPLKNGGQMMGVITLQSFKGYTFSDREKELFKALVIFFEVALSNSFSVSRKVVRAVERVEGQVRSMGHEFKHMYQALRQKWTTDLSSFFKITQGNPSDLENGQIGEIIIPGKHLSVARNFGLITYKEIFDAFVKLGYIWAGNYSQANITYKGEEPQNIEEVIRACWEMVKEVMFMTIAGSLSQRSAKNIQHLSKLNKLFHSNLYRDEFISVEISPEAEMIRHYDWKDHEAPLLKLIYALCANTIKHCDPSKKVKFRIDQKAFKHSISIENYKWPAWRASLDPHPSEIVADRLIEERKIKTDSQQQQTRSMVTRIYDSRNRFGGFIQDDWHTERVLEELLRQNFNGKVNRFDTNLEKSDIFVTEVEFVVNLESQKAV